MRILEQAVQIEEGDASQTAGLFWDKNPIHYKEDETGARIHPGLGLIAIAESMVRQNTRLQYPLNQAVYFKFSELVHEGDGIRLVRDGKKINIEKLPDGVEVARFSLISPFDVERYKNQRQRGFELDASRLRRFYDLFGIPYTREVPFVFPIGAVIATFLKYKPRVYLGKMRFNFLNQASLGELTATTEFERRKKKGGVHFFIYGRCEQDGKVICEGNGTALKVGGNQ